MHRLQHIRQTLKRGLLSVGQFGSKAQHNLIAVITVQKLGKKRPQIEICKKEVLLADFQNGCVQLRLKRLRAQPCRAEADKLRISPSFDLFNMYVKSSYADFCKSTVVRVFSCTLFN